MTHKDKLIAKLTEWEKAGMDYASMMDSLWQYHEESFLFGNLQSSMAFNKAHGLTEHARPEKSMHIIYEIMDEVVECPY